MCVSIKFDEINVKGNTSRLNIFCYCVLNLGHFYEKLAMHRTMDECG
jgi:hypothetical protein